MLLQRIGGFGFAHIGVMQAALPLRKATQTLCEPPSEKLNEHPHEIIRRRERSPLSFEEALAASAPNPGTDCGFRNHWETSFAEPCCG